MEIPKMKVLIYVLTFMTYAWSGYGSNIISNLRDAVLSAEKFFGDVVDNVITAAKNYKAVQDVLDAAVEESCDYKCPSGVEPVINKNHKPSSNGCGSYGVELHQYLKNSDITLCCNAHDICYDTCNSGKEKCDFEMQRCLYRLCDNSAITLENAVKGCKATAKMLFGSTFALGCKAYQDSQKNACYCKEKKKNKYSTGGEL